MASYIAYDKKRRMYLCWWGCGEYTEGRTMEIARRRLRKIQSRASSAPST
jgi:hypothetical protein